MSKTINFAKTLKKLAATAKEIRAANDVWAGKYGNGAIRVKKLKEAGLDAAKVQKLVNAGVGRAKSPDYATENRAKKVDGKYVWSAPKSSIKTTTKKNGDQEVVLRKSPSVKKAQYEQREKYRAEISGSNKKNTSSSSAKSALREFQKTEVGKKFTDFAKSYKKAQEKKKNSIKVDKKQVRIA